MQKRSIHALYALGTIFLLVAFAMLVDLPEDKPIILREALNALHVVLFAAAALTVLRVCHSVFPPHDHASRLKPYALSLVFCVVLAALTETAQLLTLTRTAAFSDFSRDLAGAAGALGLHFYIANWKPIPTVSFVHNLNLTLSLLLLITPLLPLAGWTVSYVERWQRFPILETFVSRPWPGFVSYNRMSAELIRADTLPIPGADLRWNRFAKLTVNPSMWPNVSLDEVVPDWTAYHALEFAMFNPGNSMRRMGIRIDDRVVSTTIDDRFSLHLDVQPGMNIFSLPLDEIENGPSQRRLHLDAIARVVIYAVDAPDSFILYLSPIALSGHPAHTDSR